MLVDLAGAKDQLGPYILNERPTADLVGPAASTDNYPARFDGISGELLKNSSNWRVDDVGDMHSNTVLATLVNNNVSDVERENMLGLMPGGKLWNTDSDRLEIYRSVIEGWVGVPPNLEDLVVVNAITDFPAVIGGVITLEAGKIYAIGGVSIFLDTIIIAVNGAALIVGVDRESSALRGGGLIGTPILRATQSPLRLRNLQLVTTAAVAIEFDSSGMGNTNDLSIEDCTLRSLISLSALIELDAVRDVSIRGCILEASNGAVVFAINSTARDLLFENNSWATGQSGFTIDLSLTTVFNGIVFRNELVRLVSGEIFLRGGAKGAGIVDRAEITDCTFIGPGSALQTILNSDPKWNFRGNQGNAQVVDSKVFSGVHSVVGATIPIITAGIPVFGDAVSVLTVGSNVFLFTANGAVLVFSDDTQSVDIEIFISCRLSPSVGSNQRLRIYTGDQVSVTPEAFAEVTASSGGGESVALRWKRSKVVGDALFRLWVSNETGTASVVIRDIRHTLSETKR